eukprot:8237154-Heterocapsa_arctica.AAC.1
MLARPSNRTSGEQANIATTLTPLALFQADDVKKLRSSYRLQDGDSFAQAPLLLPSSTTLRMPSRVLLETQLTQLLRTRLLNVIGHFWLIDIARISLCSPSTLTPGYVSVPPLEMHKVT